MTQGGRKQIRILSLQAGKSLELLAHYYFRPKTMYTLQFKGSCLVSIYRYRQFWRVGDVHIFSLHSKDLCSCIYWRLLNKLFLKPIWELWIQHWGSGHAISPLCWDLKGLEGSESSFLLSFLPQCLKHPPWKCLHWVRRGNNSLWAGRRIMHLPVVNLVWVA